MSRFSFFLLGMVTGALMLYAAMNFHVVRARDGFHMVQKQPPRMAEAYVDIRIFGMTDWAGQPQLATALVRANQQQLLGDSASGAIQDGVNQIMPDLAGTISPAVTGQFHTFRFVPSDFR